MTEWGKNENNAKEAAAEREQFFAPIFNFYLSSREETGGGLLGTI